MVLPEPPVITYNPGDTVYDGDLLTLSCSSETADPTQTDVIWIVKGEAYDGELVTGTDTVTKSIIIPTELSDNDLRYECHVIHPNLPEPHIAYARITGMLCLSPTHYICPKKAVCTSFYWTKDDFLVRRRRLVTIIWYPDFNSLCAFLLHEQPKCRETVNKAKWCTTCY